jgi:cyclophilin family peptidyl-prolyl cis-trans isomerase
MDDYLKSYECSICNPVKRGKKPNPEFANLPKTLTCKCGKTVAANVYQLKKKAEKNNTTIQKLIEGFVCQQCKPTIGVTVGGRRALTVEEKTDRINAKASIKDAKKLARAERKAEKEKQKALKNSMPKRKRGRPRKNLTSTE